MSQAPAALVTGASKRLGKAMAEYLHTRGYRVIIHYGESAVDAQALETQFNTRRDNSATAIQADLSNADCISGLARASLAQWGRLDLLINNASMFQADSDTFDSDLWQKQTTINSMAPYALARHLQQALNQSGGNIINMVDIYADRPLAEHHSYCVSKAGINILVKSLAIELAPHVRVNGIAPGAILWPDNQSDISNNDYQQALLSKIPLKKLGSVEAIVSALAFILDCDYLNGQVINIDGGRSITI